MSGNNWFHGGRRVLWAAALTFGVGSAATAGTVIVDSNVAYPNPGAGTPPVYGDFVTGFGTGNGNNVALTGASGWGYSTVRKDTTVGINTAYARSGDGSAYFNVTSGSGKADVQYLSATSLGKLNDLSVLGYDWYRDSSSTVNQHYAPVLRLIVTDGATTRQVIYEPNNNGSDNGFSGGVAPTDVWKVIDAYNGGDGKFWVNNPGNPQLGTSISALKSAFDPTNSTTSYGDWDVIGFNVGVGSGWMDGNVNGTFIGAADNITIGFTTTVGGESVTTSTTYNFEVPGAPNYAGGPGAVPEPASVAMGLIAGVAGLVVAARRRSA